MFINLENGTLKLYDLKMYKGLEKVKLPLMYDSPYVYREKKVSEQFNVAEERLGNQLWIRTFSEKLGIAEPYDFYSSYQTFYQNRYKVYQLNEVFLILEDLEKNYYAKLELLNRLILGVGRNQGIFEKYRKQILANIRLVEILSKSYLETKELYFTLLHNAKGELRDELKKLMTILPVYEMDIAAVPKRVKSRSLN